MIGLKSTEVTSLCFVNYARPVTLRLCCIGIKFNQILFFKIIYKHIESVYLVCHKLFCQRNVNFILYNICKHKHDSSFVYITTTSLLCISLVT